MTTTATSYENPSHNCPTCAMFSNVRAGTTRCTQAAAHLLEAHGVDVRLRAESFATSCFLTVDQLIAREIRDCCDLRRLAENDAQQIAA